MASQLPNGRQTFYDINGDPLVSGKVYFYVPNTTTPKDTWQDADEIALNTNPIVLDALGSAVIFGNGAYRQILEDSLGNQIWDELTYSPGSSSGGAVGTAVYDNKAAVQAVTVPTTIDVVEILGYTTPFDNGGGMYERAGALPAHNGYIQDASGAIFILRTETVCMEMFGGFPNGSTVTAAWNNMLGYAKAENVWQGFAFEGGYWFFSKPNAIDFSFSFKGKGVSKTTLRRNYSEAANSDAFYNIVCEIAGTSTNGAQIEGFSLVAETGTSLGIMLQFTTEGPISGFYTASNIVVTYVGTGQFDRCCNLDGMLNTTLASQGLRGTCFKNVKLFAPTSATYALVAANVIAANLEIETFGASANAGVLITGGTAPGDADKSQDVRLDVDAIGTLTVTNSFRVNSWGDVNGLRHDTGAVECNHIGTVGSGGYFQSDLFSNTFAVAPSITPLSPEVGALAGFRNGLINGNMEIDQRSAGAAKNILNTWAYCVDRWGVVCGALPTGTLTAQRVSGAAFGTNNAVRIARSAGVFGQNIAFAQIIEGRNCLRFLNKRVTLSFLARKGSNFQGANFAASIIIGTVADQGITGVLAGTWTGWTNIGQAINIPLTTSPVKYTVRTTLPVNANVREIGILFDTGLFSGTGDANDWVEITNVQFEQGSISDAYAIYEETDPSLQMLLCQRYCVAGTASTLAPVGSGFMQAANSCRILVTGPPMRTAPTIPTAMASLAIASGGASFVPSALASTSIAPAGTMLNFTVAGATTNQTAALTIVTPTVFIMDAELN